MHHNAGLGTTLPSRSLGRPHVCDEVVHVNGAEFARGKVRHPDHATKTMATWHRVRKNEEDIKTTIKGSRWMD